MLINWKGQCLSALLVTLLVLYPSVMTISWACLTVLGIFNIKVLLCNTFYSIVGHVIRFNHTGPKEGGTEQNSWILENSLMPFMEENKVSSLLQICQTRKKTGDANKIVHTHQVKAFNCLHIRLAVSWGNSFFWCLGEGVQRLLYPHQVNTWEGLQTGQTSTVVAERCSCSCFSKHYGMFTNN